VRRASRIGDQGQVDKQAAVRRLTAKDTAILDAVSASCPELIFIFDDANTVMFLNHAACEALGIQPEDVLGKNFRELGLSEEIVARQEADLDIARGKGDVARTEIEIDTAQGPRSFEWITFPVLGGARTPGRAAIAARDVTDRKQSEEQSETLRREFYSAVSHELKTPLTVIKGLAFLGIAAPSITDADHEKVVDVFRDINLECDRLSRMVDNLLDIARVEAGTFSVEPSQGDLSEIVDQAVRTFRQAGYLHQVQVRVPERLPAVKADKQRVVQVLVNLLTNAAKSSPAGSPIRLVAKKGATEVVVTVRDRGVGIAADELPRLFKKFSRSSRSTAGTGLGLWISKSIIEAHGGTIWAQSDGVGKGSSFTFTLPLMCAPERPAALEANNPRVVAIDDEPSILRFVERFLAGAGFHVATTTDPVAAHDLITFEQPEVVILDVWMPEKNGLEVLEEIRASSRMPVIMITASENEQEVARAKSFPRVWWLRKPFAPDELVEAVKIATRLAHNGRS